MRYSEQQALGRALEAAYGRYNEQGTKYAAEHYARLWDILLDALKAGAVDVEPPPTHTAPWVPTTKPSNTADDTEPARDY